MTLYKLPKRVVFLYVLSFLLLTQSDFVFCQYINGVTIPDKKIPTLTEKEATQVRFAHAIDAKNLRTHLNVIAADSMEGRETGKTGLLLAGNYISKVLKNIGLDMIGSSYQHPVAFTFSNWLNTNMTVNSIKFRHLWDYIAFAHKNEGITTLETKEVLFLGYGIDDPKYSDYKKVDVKNKIIIINRGEPLNKDSISFITGTKKSSPWSDYDLQLKLKTAKAKGVRMVLIIENDIKKFLEENRKKVIGNYLELGNTLKQGNQEANHVFISTTIAREIFGSKEKKIIKARNRISKGKPSNVALDANINISLEKKVELLEGYNIIAYIKGKSKPNEYVVLSAHYDHLGKRGEEIFNGADDNGSGTVTLLELAKVYQQAVLEGNTPERSIVFIWFCGEEKGLLGSEYFTTNPTFPLNQIVANVNIDMVGRMDKKYINNPDYIYVIGSDRLSSQLHEINERVNQNFTQLTLDYTYNDENDPNKYYYRSDHYNFGRLGIPAIFYFNGTHEDYHRPTDDIQKINFDKMAKIAQLIFYTVWELSNMPQKLVVDKAIK